MIVRVGSTEYHLTPEQVDAIVQVVTPTQLDSVFDDIEVPRSARLPIWRALTQHAEQTC